MLENLRGSRNDMDFMVADFENGDNAKDILAQSDKEYTVIFSKEEMEKMASDPKYYAEKMHSIEGALRMSDEINAQFGFERTFGKTNGNADADNKNKQNLASLLIVTELQPSLHNWKNHQPVRKNILKRFRKRKLLRRKRQRKRNSQNKPK